MRVIETIFETFKVSKKRNSFAKSSINVGFGNDSDMTDMGVLRRLFDPPCIRPFGYCDFRTKIAEKF